MNRILLLLGLVLAGCIGTDEVDDPIVGESILVDRQQIAMLPCDTAQVNAQFFNRYGIEENLQVIWTSSQPEVATVEPSGLVIAQGLGQSNLRASVGNTQSAPVLVTVVASATEVAQIILSSASGTEIAIGQELQLEVETLDVNGSPVPGVQISYSAMDPEILSVNEEGVVTGLANGFGRIVAAAGNIQSNVLGIQVGQTSRTGSFIGANGYDAAGDTELFIADNGDLMLRLEDNFDTDFALGTFIYLSNSTQGSITRNEGLEIQEVTTGGAHLFNVSNVDPSIGISDFAYVIVLCKPATITFGYAQLD